MELQSGAAKLPNADRLPLPCKLLQHLREFSQGHPIQAAFGVDLSQAQTLIEAKTLTISKLMTIMPPGTLDPSPFIYNNTMYTMAALVSAGAGLHLLVRPVDPKYFEKN